MRIEDITDLVGHAGTSVMEKVYRSSSAESQLTEVDRYLVLPFVR